MECLTLTMVELDALGSMFFWNGFLGVFGGFAVCFMAAVVFDLFWFRRGNSNGSSGC